MPNDLVKASPVSVPAIVTPLSLPELVERPGERHASLGMNSSMPSITIRQKAYQSAVWRFLAWCKGRGSS